MIHITFLGDIIGNCASEQREFEGKNPQTGTVSYSIFCLSTTNVAPSVQLVHPEHNMFAKQYLTQRE